MKLLLHRYDTVLTHCATRQIWVAEGNDTPPYPELLTGGSRLPAIRTPRRLRGRQPALIGTLPIALTDVRTRRTTTFNLGLRESFFHTLHGRYAGAVLSLDAVNSLVVSGWLDAGDIDARQAHTLVAGVVRDLNERGQLCGTLDTTWRERYPATSTSPLERPRFRYHPTALQWTISDTVPTARVTQPMLTLAINNAA